KQFDHARQRNRGSYWLLGGTLALGVWTTARVIDGLWTGVFEPSQFAVGEDLWGPLALGAATYMVNGLQDLARTGAAASTWAVHLKHGVGKEPLPRADGIPRLALWRRSGINPIDDAPAKAEPAQTAAPEGTTRPAAPAAASPEQQVAQAAQ